MTVNMGPGATTAYNPRCLQRDFSSYLAVSTINTTIVDWVLSADSYSVFDFHTQGTGLEVAAMTDHAGGHMSVGGDIGEMGNMYSSPGDPLFFLHHANLDRLWNEWQRSGIYQFFTLPQNRLAFTNAPSLKDWDTRKSEITGPDTMFAYPFDFMGDVPYTNITLATELQYLGLFANVNISSVMDINTTNLCYEYV
jgi:tyrosinase